MAGQVNIEETPSTSTNETENEKAVGVFSKCIARLSYNDDGTPTVLEDDSYVFVKDDGTSFSLNCKLIDINVDNQIVRVVADDASVEEISLVCRDALYADDNETGASVDVQEAVDDAGGDSVPVEGWGDTPTRLLISLYVDLISRVKTREIRTFKVMWERMSQLMQEQGYACTGRQISNRFKTLKRAYMKRKFDRKHQRMRKGRIKPLRRCPYERELDELFARQSEIFPHAVHVIEDEDIFRAQFMAAGTSLEIAEFLNEEEQLQQCAEAGPSSSASPVAEILDHTDHTESRKSDVKTGKSGTRKKPRPNALAELRNLRASTLERLTCMDVKRDAFHEEVLEELKHKNAMLERLLELVTKEPMH